MKSLPPLVWIYSGDAVHKTPMHDSDRCTRRHFKQPLESRPNPYHNVHTTAPSRFPPARLAMRFAISLPLLFAIATPVVADGPVDYLKDVKPILRQHCVSCHNATNK